MYLSTDNVHFKSVDGVLYSNDLKVLIKFPSCKLSNEFVVSELVNEISDYAFENVKNLKKLRFEINAQVLNLLPNQYKIGSYAFYNCVGLLEIEVPTYFSIDKGAFKNCKNMVSFSFIKDDLKFNNDKSECRAIQINQIEDDTFSNCESLIKFNIPSSIESIGKEAFKGCISLEIVRFELPSSIKNIGKSAFYDCKKLESIYLPGSLNSIGEYAFLGCSNILVLSKNKRRESSLGFYDYFNFNKSEYYLDKAGLEYSIYNQKAKVINYIGNNISIAIPSSILFNGENCVVEDVLTLHSKTLRSLIIPNSVNEINKNFLENEKHTVLYIESIDTLINLKDKMNKNEITSYYLNDLLRIEDYEFIRSEGKVILARYLGSDLHIQIPNTIKFNMEEFTVTSIGKNAFYNCVGIESITIPNGITSIGESSFASCKSIKKVIIPETICQIGEKAFHGCESLEGVDISENIKMKYIPDRMFWYCKNLYSFNVPNSIKKIGTQAFEGCERLKLVNFNETSKIKFISISAFDDCSSLEKIIIPWRVPQLPWGVFRNCTSLHTVEFQQTSQLKVIDDYAFSNCTNLKNIFIPKSVESVSRHSFEKCESLNKDFFIYLSKSNLFTDIGKNTSIQSQTELDKYNNKIDEERSKALEEEIEEYKRKKLNNRYQDNGLQRKIDNYEKNHSRELEGYDDVWGYYNINGHFPWD